ncbi:MAG TPA: sigma-70 family RNA polymerase sigma factor [Streptosporangiaceae bacterium]
MADDDWLAREFETHRGRLRSLAYRMLGSLNEADDVVQEAWLRLSRLPAGEVENLGAWLTTVTGRICLDMLRSRQARREEVQGVYMPDPVVYADGAIGPEDEALLADSVGLALMVVLNELNPAERLAFVLHDMFAVPYEDIALIVGRSPNATKMLASRARRRLTEGAPEPERDVTRQREVVGAFLAASRAGEFDALVALLDPDVVLRADGGAAAPDMSRLLRGAAAVAGQALMFSRMSTQEHAQVLVNGTAGLLRMSHGRPATLMAFTIARGKIIQIDILADPDRLRQLDVSLPPD